MAWAEIRKGEEGANTKEQQGFRFTWAGIHLEFKLKIKKRSILEESFDFCESKGLNRKNKRKTFQFCQI